MADKPRQGNKPAGTRFWPLLALNFFMADMQSGIGPFIGVFLLQHGWASGRIGTAMTVGNVADMLITTPVGAFSDASRHKRLWVIIPGAAVVAASFIILVRQDFWAVAVSQIATSVAGSDCASRDGHHARYCQAARLQPAEWSQPGLQPRRQHGGRSLSGYLGWQFGYLAVFLLAALFGVIAINCVLMIPHGSINDRAARGSKEDDPESQPSAFRVLLRHKPLLVLSLALAAFQLGSAAIVPLYGMAAVSGGKANGPSFVASTIVIAQGVMVVTSLIGMRAAEGRNYWPIILVSFLAMPVRGVLAYFLTGWWGVIPVQVLDGVGAGLQSVAVPGLVVRSLDGTGRINLAQGAVITIQGAGAALSPALGGWFAQWLGFAPAFLLLAGLGPTAVALWIVLGPAVKQY